MADPLVTLSVWAPHATSVDALVAERRLPLSPDASAAVAGTWTIALPAGTDYLLSVDEAPGRPDPRSRHQPFGVHGASRVVDPTTFVWTDAAWPGVDVLGKVFYELHVGTFTPDGTLDAAIDRLPHLRDLGVDVVELMPLAAFVGQRGWGYDGVGLYAVHETYGGPAALARFVDAAHAHGLGVCLDVVHNHLGPTGNYLATFGPYVTAKHTTPWGDAVNLDDAGAEGVRAFILDSATQWFRDFHVDALRLDAVHALIDDSPRHLLADLSDHAAALASELGRPCALIAESDLNDAAMVTPTASGGLGMDAQWADDVHHALHAWLSGERFGYYVDFGSPETLAHALTRVFVHEGGHSTFRGRPWGAPVPPGTDLRRFVAFTSNHDQVGNRGLGDRPESRLTPGRVAAGAALLLLGPFTPLLFQGAEWATRRPFQFFTDHEPTLAELVTQGRLAEFGGHGWADLYGPDLAVPDPQHPATFAASVLDWSERDVGEHAAILAWHTELIALRRAHIAGGHLSVRADHGPGWFRLEHGPLSVVVGSDAGVHVPGRSRLLTAWGPATTVADGIVLGPDAVAVLTD